MAFYRLPFCSSFEEFNRHSCTTKFIAGLEECVWGALSGQCRNNILVVTLVVAFLTLLSILFNVVAIASALNDRSSKHTTDCDPKRSRLINTHINSNWSKAVFRIWLGICGLLSSCVLVPLIAVRTYYMLTSPLVCDNSSDPRPNPGSMEYICSGLFHMIVSLHIYAMLGTVGERWFTLLRIDPAEFAAKRSKPNFVASDRLSIKRRDNFPEKRNPAPSRARGRVPVIMYVLIACILSVTLGLLAVFLGKVRFLLFVEELMAPNVYSNSALVGIALSKSLPMTISYAVLIYTPILGMLVLLLLVTYGLVATKKTAKQITALKNAKNPISNKSAIEHYSMVDLVPIKKSSSRKIRTKGESEASYSHKAEHSQQVVLNCHETSLADIIIDSIQIEEEPGSASRPSRIESLTPRPPSWLKNMTFECRRPDSSPVKINDPATISTQAKSNCVISIFREIKETRATLITVTTMCILILPLAVLLALDVAGSFREIYSNNLIQLTTTRQSVSQRIQNLTLPTNQTGSPINHDGYHVIGGILTNLATVFLSMFIMSGFIHFFIYYLTSPSCRRGCRKTFQCKARNDSKYTSSDNMTAGLTYLTVEPQKRSWDFNNRVNSTVYETSDDCMMDIDARFRNDDI
uniref:uncharacterized protein LOC108949411 n=1 Tax=Ciona intestinalis TaxID=7719 RepID=UPI00089DB563|nr:uncharacterized protein LOC108949411 [Ciona intestinalis]|eukprot:XP_018666961.1 uncharacterized protein LOC108949411 [Ciona intestinalis]